MEASTSEADATPKVEVLEGAKFAEDPTQITYVIYEEDHTIGNALKHIVAR